MHRRVDALKEAHARLRILLAECESTPTPELPPLLNRLREELRPHLEAKEALYAQAASLLRSQGTPTEVSLLGIFRTNLGVVSGAVMGFLAAPDPQPERLRQRLGAVTGALRTLLATEEKVVFPLCVRYSEPAGPGGRRPLARMEGGRR